MGRGNVAHEQQRDIVGLACATSEVLDRFENRLLEIIQRSVVPIGKSFTEPRDTIHLFVAVHGFGDTIAEQDQRVIGLEFHAGRHVMISRDEADRKRTFGEGFGDIAVSKQEWRRMARVNELKPAVAAKYAEEHGGVAANLGMFA